MKTLIFGIPAVKVRAYVELYQLFESRPLADGLDGMVQAIEWAENQGIASCT